MKNNDVYKKTAITTTGKNKTIAQETVKNIVYSTDPRDLKNVEKGVPCQAACPAGTNIPGYIRCIHEKRYGRSYELNRMYNILPGVLGRICTRPCELACRHGESDLGEPVSICWLKRAAADLKSPMHRIMEGLYSPTDKKVAVIGAGPSGLGAAHELAVMGHRVTIIESYTKPGGMLKYGIPDFRLPEALLNFEIENILRLGVELKTGINVGKDILISELTDTYDAVVVATGCTNPYRLNVPGENLENVYNGLDFMKRINLGERPYVGKQVMVIGDGFTAMDCARSAVRLGADEVKINIRKTEEYMPIDDHEIVEVKYEKIRFYSLVETMEVIGNNGKVEGVKFSRTKLEYSKTPPFRKSVIIPNSEFVVPADSVIAAIGQQPDLEFVFSGSTLGRPSSESGTSQFETSVPGVYVAGDCIAGGTNVITAIASGRECALSVDAFLTGKIRKTKVVRQETTENTDRDRSFDFIGRSEMNTLDYPERMISSDNEVEIGLTDDQAAEESKRCYLCNLKYEIDIHRCIYCSACIDVAPRDCIKMIENIDITDDGAYGDFQEAKNWSQTAAIYIDNAKCIRCGQCHVVCPVDCISITKTELIELNHE